MNTLSLQNKKVCLFSDHHICINPRLWKEAFYYENRGYEVVILTMWQSNIFLEKDKQILRGHNIVYISYLNIIPGENSILINYFYRIRKRVSSELHRFFKVGLSWSISHAPEKMYKVAIQQSADLYIAHLECAFFVARKLIKAGKNVAYDFEDWYSRDYLVPGRPVKLLKSVENFAIENGKYITAASNSMANALKKAYRSDKPIYTIYNGFSISENEGLINVTKLSSGNKKLNLLWFSRTVGPFRGIEKFVNALRFCNRDISLHLLGFLVDGYDLVIKEQIENLSNIDVYFHDFIDHKNLLHFIAQFDIGLALEENINPNRNLTVTNKVLQYLQAGLHIICSDTEGHKEVKEKCSSCITIVDIDDPISISTAINQIDLNNLKFDTTDYMSYDKYFSWESQSEKLTSLIKNDIG